ncbi:MAG: ATP-binding protein [Leptospirales bacterium]
MLIRFTVNNILSFGKEVEFNMIPSPRYTRLSDHKYVKKGFEVLKLASIYGANGAGKSNLINAMLMLKDIVTREQLPKNIDKQKFKFANADNNTIILGVEFFQQEQAYYYAIEIGDKQVVVNEELYISKLGKGKDKLLFERKILKSGKSQIKFSDKFESDKENLVLKSVIEKNLSKHNKPIIKLLTTLDNPDLKEVNHALDWFANTLQIMKPDDRPAAIAHEIDINQEFREYAQDIMCTFNLGISNIKSERREIKEFFGDEGSEKLNNLIEELEKDKDRMAVLRSDAGDEVVLVRENEEIFIKQLQLEHTGGEDLKAYFNLGEESDGTIRLLDFIPAFKNVVSGNKVFIIDEIERSIHPLLIKELVNKFSKDNNTNGQLIFSTHESNLLDQDLFRQDEIWFVEKDNKGRTDLYSLSDYKEHSTIDIRRGYLAGRYGSIPFLANLEDLNWHKYDN